MTGLRVAGRADRTRRLRLWAAGAALVVLAGCDDLPTPGFLDRDEAEAPVQEQSTRLIERDVEAPEVFQVSEAGLWDGRPSLGGVWVAHPDVTEPERVIIRNTANGKFVIGALFKRERAIPGPRLQVSSDAAEALGLLAGAPVQLNVTALRRETVPDPEAVVETPPDVVGALDAPEAISETALEPAAVAGEVPAAAVEAAAAPVPAAAPQPAPRASDLDRPYLQIGIFSVKANAERAADQMRNAGMIPRVVEQSTSGKTFWRVLVGPAADSAERNDLLAKIKDVGFTDAYAVTN